MNDVMSRTAESWRILGWLFFGAGFIALITMFLWGVGFHNEPVRFVGVIKILIGLVIFICFMSQYLSASYNSVYAARVPTDAKILGKFLEGKPLSVEEAWFVPYYGGTTGSGALTDDARRLSLAAKSLGRQFKEVEELVKQIKIVSSSSL